MDQWRKSVTCVIYFIHFIRLLIYVYKATIVNFLPIRISRSQRRAGRSSFLFSPASGVSGDGKNSQSAGQRQKIEKQIDHFSESQISSVFSIQRASSIKQRQDSRPTEGSPLIDSRGKIAAPSTMDRCIIPFRLISVNRAACALRRCALRRSRISNEGK